MFGYATFAEVTFAQGPVEAAASSPVNTVPGAQTAKAGVSLAISGISVTDADGDLATTALSVLTGTLTVGLSGGATISAGANISSALTLSGTEAQINDALATLVYLSNVGGSDTLTVLSTDDEALTDTDTVSITVDATGQTVLQRHRPSGPYLSRKEFEKIWAALEDARRRAEELKRGKARRALEEASNRAREIAEAISDVNREAVSRQAAAEIVAFTASLEAAANASKTATVFENAKRALAQAIAIEEQLEDDEEAITLLLH